MKQYKKETRLNLSNFTIQLQKRNTNMFEWMITQGKQK